jgi:transposase-like protein
MSKTRRNHGSAFKAKVALEALKGEQTVAEIASKHGLHSTLVNEWKRQLADGASSTKGRARPRRPARRWSASFTGKSASRKWNCPPCLRQRPAIRGAVERDGR